MKKILLGIIISVLTLSACQKNKGNSTTVTTDIKVLESQVITDFANQIALPSYKDLAENATKLNQDIGLLKNEPTAAHLKTAQDSWMTMRSKWEQCEGFLFGPVEDNDYDPNMDTWPTNFTSLDSLLHSNNNLSVSEITKLDLALRGYHPIEYIMWGKDGKKLATAITEREKLYINSLSTDLNNTCTALYQSWNGAPENFVQEVANAGNGSKKFKTKSELFQAIVGGLTDICDEVGNSKMKDPFDLQNPNLVESPYSGSSISDFKNNIIGLQNVYLGRYQNKTHKSISDLVNFYNKNLDNTIKNQITATINSFDNITLPYGQAISQQKPQVVQTMTALENLKNTLEGQLKPFIVQYIKD